MSRRNRVISLSASFGFAALSAACVQILGIDSTTVADNDSGTVDASNDATSDDASVDGSSDAGIFACVGHKPVFPAAPSTITLTADMTDFFTKATAPGMQVFVCPQSSDPSCSGVTGPFTSDDGGVATVPINVGTGGFVGYLKVNGSVNVSDPDGGSHVEGTVPYLWYFYAPIVADGTYPLQVFATSEFALLLSATGATNDPLRGQLAVQVTDCENTPAANVQVTTSTADDASTPFAIQGALPVAQAVPTTDVSGLAGVFNLPATTTRVIATPVSLGRPSGELTLLIRQGSLTTIRLQPNQ